MNYPALSRLLSNRPPELFDPSFPQQRDFCYDPAKLKLLFCTRRAAKSSTGGLHIFKDLEEEPGSNGLFIGLTRLTAKGIIWKDVLKKFNEEKDLGASFNSSELTMTLSNGSVCYVTGVDADEDEMNKLLGKKYKIIVIDEGSLYTIDLRRLIYGVLKPAVADQRGTICILGTSSNFTKGLFYDITNGLEAGWSIHTWTAHDNPFVAKQWQEELDEIDRDRPLFKETPLYKQWYLNQWVIETDKLVYKFNQERNLFVDRPVIPHNPEWSYVLGVDLGYEDDSAFVLCAFHENHDVMYIVNTFNKKHMDITDVANRIKSYCNQYPIGKVIIDGSDKQSVEEMRMRHGIAAQAAEKQGKEHFIEILNAELIQGKIKIHKNCNNLIQELSGLVWKTTGDTIDIPRKEHPSLPNHLCDAFLYAWRYCYQYAWEVIVKKPIAGTKEWHEEQNRELWEREREKIEADWRAANGDEW